ncbi:MAG: LD-carboxypeptidase [Bacteroidales bacterium]|nr:LD-carboxypeptidase [Bacteroidales bacterium]
MIRPKFLEDGNTIAIVSPSGPIKSDSLDFAIETINSWGLKTSIGKHAFDKYGVFAGTDADRAADFQKALNDKKVKAILCARGGYGAIRIVDLLDFSKFLKHPKWIVGFSDITVLHAKIQSIGVESIHGTMAKSFPSVTEKSLKSLHDTLFGKYSQTLKSTKSKFNRAGKCKGELIGGNLSMLYSMRGVPFEYDYTGKILFIEDLNEYLYHIDRMIQNLKHSGILSRINGLVVGTMSGMKNGVDEYAGSIEEIILDAVSEYNYPVMFDFPSGHEADNQAMIFGTQHKMNVGGTRLTV